MCDDTPLSFDSPESSTVTRADYDPGQQVLRVWVLKQRRPLGTDGQECYRYTGVPPETWREFEQAGSRGRFWNLVIRPMYEGSLE